MSEETARVCKASRTADPPQDCDIPFCGCVPAWLDALTAAKESGWCSASEAADLRAQRSEPGACTNKGCVLEDRVGKSYHCNGHAQWCTACLRWHYEPLEAQLAAATARIEAMTTNAEALEARAAEHEQTRDQVERDGVAIRTLHAECSRLTRARDQAEVQVQQLRAALSNLLQEPLTGYLGSRSVRIDATLTPEAYDALRALLAEPGA